MRRLLPFFLLPFAFCVLPCRAADAPIPTKEAAAKFTLPKGFKVTLFAGEPDIVQPIAFTFDDRGRMWVVECMMYPKWSQDGKGGKDRVVILEDTDGDGTFDKKTVILDDGVNLSGIEFGFGGIYLCSSPNLIFIPIKDDKPGKPEILLDGWNIKEAKHNVFNSLIWGPDGWLYGCNGIQTKSYVGTPGTPKEKRQLFDCGVWKFHPTKKIFEIVANGTTNPFGLDFDEHGEMFITNCVIDHLFHIVPGGHYTRMYGNDPNPYVYGAMGSCVDYKHWGGGDWQSSRANQKTGELKKEHDDAGGGHAHSGCAIYQGENFPAEYRNTLFTCNIHGNRLNNDGLERTKSGMKGVRRPDFAFANDPWFRGICVKQGPEGALYVSDWCDTGECHNYDKADVTNGRIYRISYGDVKAWKGDVGKFHSEELIKAVASKNEWLSRRARLEIQERDAKHGRAYGDYVQIFRDAMSKAESPHELLRYFWALNGIGQISATEVSRLFAERPKWSDDERSAMNTWAIRYFFTLNADSQRQLYEHLKPCMEKGSGLEQLHFFNAAMNSTVESPFLKHKELYSKLSPDNPNAQLMQWFAIEKEITTKDAAVDWFNSTSTSLSRRNIIKKYMALYADDTKPLVKLLSDNGKRPDHLVDLFVGLQFAYASQAKPKGEAFWNSVDQSLFPDEARAIVDELNVKFGVEKAIAAMIDRAMQNHVEVADRIRAIHLLSNRKTAGFEETLLNLLGKDAAVRAAAIRGLGNYNDPGTPKAILDLYAKLTPEEKADAVQTLASRPKYASALLEAVAKGTVPKGDITAFTARQIASLKDKTVVAELEKVWGKVQPASANRAEQMKKYKAILTPENLKSGDAKNGKAIFTKNCATCHKLFGEGQSVGPELTGSQRSNLDYLLENILDPSAVVANEYKMTNFYLGDGRIVSGIIKGENAAAVTVRTVNEEIVIAKKEIDERKPTQLSVMPEGLFDSLKPDDVRDLVSYLMSKEPIK